jgi:hypothetical protein
VAFIGQHSSYRVHRIGVRRPFPGRHEKDRIFPPRPIIHAGLQVRVLRRDHFVVCKNVVDFQDVDLSERTEASSTDFADLREAFPEFLISWLLLICVAAEWHLRPAE